MKNTEIKEKYTKPETIREMLAASAAKYGDKTAYKYYSAPDTVSEMSYKQFFALYNNIGTSLCGLGLQKKKIAIVSESRPEWIVAYIAVIGCGSVVVPLDKELMDAQIKAFLEYAGVSAVFCSGKYTERLLAMDVSGLEYIIDFDGKADHEGTLSFRELAFEGERQLFAGNNRFRNSRYDPSKMCALIFTSGTTGTSKGVMLSEDNILASMTASANMICFSSNNVLLSVLPMHHTYELCCGQLTALMLGLTVCINNSLKYFMRNLKLFRPTAMVLVPLFVTTIRKKIEDEIKKKNRTAALNVGVTATKALKKIGVDIRKLVFSQINAPLGGRLRSIICGGAPIDPQTIEWFENIGINISQGYGITECAPLVSVNPLVTVHYDSVGLPIKGSKIKIIDDTDGVESDMPPRSVGEICVRGPQVMLGYYNAPEETAAAFTEEGYFRTGDYGFVDEDGYIYITGRKKNIIVLNNGKNVYPEEIEEYLDRLDIIRECVVVGREKEDGEVVLTAIIYPDYDAFKGKDDSEIIEAIRAEVATINKKLPIFKQVRNIELKKSEFEKTTTKKIIRYKLS